MRSVHFWGAVKETHVPGLGEFHQQYFQFPLYKDEGLELYKALGNNKVRLKTWNPIRWFTGFRSLNTRLKSNNIEGNLKGEGLLQGGVLIFKDGELKYGFEEDTGEPLDIDHLRGAIRSLQGAQSGVLSADEL